MKHPRKKSCCAKADEKCAEVFALFDSENTGKIWTADLGVILRVLGKYPTETEVRELVQEFDPNDTGVLDCKQLRAIQKRELCTCIDEAKLRAAFKVFDEDKSGFIPADELYHAMLTMGEKLSVTEALEMIREADLNEDGLIDYEEFVTMLLIKM